MFCKWCGNSIQLTDKKCPTCGRETPPMSDCGGLYDLRHSVNDSQHQTQTCPRPVVMQCPIVEKMEPKYARDRKAAKNHHTMTMVCFVVVLLTIACSALLALRVNNQLRELEEQIDNIRIEMPTYPTAPNLEEPAGEKEDNPPAESTQYCFTINTTVVNGDSKEISNTYDFGNYAKSVKVTTSMAESENEQVFTVSYALNDEASIELNLKYVQEETEALVISTKCNTDMTFFTNQDFSYEWQCRTENGSWLTVDPTLVTENDGYYSLLYNENLWRNVGEEKAMKDIRCVIKIKDIKGNMMTITVDGCGLSQDVSLR